MTTFTPGKLVSLRGRDWVVLPSNDPELLVVKPLGGSDDEITGIFLPLDLDGDQPEETTFPNPTVADLGDITTTRLLHDASRLSFRNGAGPFRSLAKLSFRPRSYQMVPLIMSLRLQTIRMLIADDVGVGKTIEALLIAKEQLERRNIKRFAVVCLPHLCDQWQAEIKDKLGLDAVVIRTNTQARLDREIQGDVSVYSYYPYQIISIDFIKSDTRRQVFINECPELLIVDEAHSCSRPMGATKSQQQRHALIADIAAKEDQHLVLLTATPHSGKNEEFQSLLGLLDPKFEQLEVANSTQAERRELAKHFVQRKRGDVIRWVEDTPFPKREPGEFPYELTRKYAQFFDRILEFARELYVGGDGQHQKRMHYWTALGLLRGVMSSPAAGVEMLQTRMDKLQHADEPNLEDSKPVHDTLEGYDTDLPPARIIEQTKLSESQIKKLRSFAKELESLSGPKTDSKLATTGQIIRDWLDDGFNTVIFCKYIQTANYVGQQLQKLLEKKYKDIDIQVITSEDADEIRKQRIDAMEPTKPLVLVCTDCLSEGINLHDNFTAVLHYDLPWNPNRLEQREGRVDRYGQTKPVVKAHLLYGSPIDGIVLDVILRKVREIKKATGINVPFPENSQSIIDTIAQALLVNPDRKIATRQLEDQMEFDFQDFAEAQEAKVQASDKLNRLADQEKASRAIFAQNAIKAHEIEQDLKDTDDAIGDPKAVEEFVFGTINNLLGAQLIEFKDGYRLFTNNLPATLASTLPANDGEILISFKSPTPPKFQYVGRNHPFVEQLCQLVMANTINRRDKHAARAAVIRTEAVKTKTTILLFRVRNVIESKNAGQQIVAEEMLVWGYRGTATDGDHLSTSDATALLKSARPTSNMTPQRRSSELGEELDQLKNLADTFDDVANERCEKLVEAHERFSQLMDKKRFKVVHPVLPMDVMGIYILLPDNASKAESKA
jgi:superfamily II DNA or RNA helicase